MKKLVLIAMLCAVSSCSAAAGDYQGRNAKAHASPLVKWPTPTGSVPVDWSIRVVSEYDGKMRRYYGVADLGSSSQDEDQPPLFELENGAVLKNVILGDPAADGIHCKGSCTLINVWWEEVGEDAATFRGKLDSDVMLVDGGGAASADDKVFQNNGRGTMIIKNFYVEWFGKLYRSCGNCSVQTKRRVIIENVTAVAGPDSAALVGVNVNYGDVAEFRGHNRVFDKWNRMPICLRYEGNSSGLEPKKLGHGADDKYCLYNEHNLAHRTE
jgi:pectate lyase